MACCRQDHAAGRTRASCIAPRAARPATIQPIAASSPEVVAGDDDYEEDEDGICAPEHSGDRMARDKGAGRADHQGEGAVHAGDRRVGIDERLHQGRVVVDRDHVEGVGEAELFEEPRRRGRDQRVADQREAHRDHEHVAHEVEVIVAIEVEPDQEHRRDHEVGVQVREVRQVEDPRPEHQVLQAFLEERAGGALEVDHRVAVGEGLVGVALSDPSDGLVGEVSEHEQADLPDGVDPAVGQARCVFADGFGETRHDPGIVVTACSHFPCVRSRLEEPRDLRDQGRLNAPRPVTGAVDLEHFGVR